MPEPARRRRVDRVTASDYLDGLDGRTPAQVRTMRDECREEEARLSYARRLLHGQLDIVRAELARRQGGGSEGLVDALSDILSDAAQQGPRTARSAPLYVPDGEHGRRRGDRVLDEMPLSRLPDLDDEEIADLVGRLAEEERAISAMRRTILDHVDRLQAELVGRYRSGDARVDEAVTSAVGGIVGDREAGGA